MNIPNKYKKNLQSIAILIIVFILILHYFKRKINIDFLPYAFYINLKYRKDRFYNVQKQMYWWPKKKLIRIDAIKKKDSALGCRMSHLKALKKAKKIAIKQNQKYVLILEDDFGWKYRENKTIRIFKKIFDSEVNWDVITLIKAKSRGIIHGDKNAFLRRITDIATTASYIIKTDYIDTLIKLWSDIRFKKDESQHIDQQWKKLQETDNWYVKTLVKQISSKSDIDEETQLSESVWE